MGRRTTVLVLLLAVGALSAADADPLLEPDRGNHRQVLPPVQEPIRRERPSSELTRLLGPEQPVLAPSAWWIRWDDYRTVIVVDHGGGQARPAWVATYDAMSGLLVVAYRAMARVDADGTLRIDSHAAVISGPQSWQWSPDSFLIGRDRQVTAYDDNPSHPGNHGEVERMIDGRKDGEAYRPLLRAVIALVGGAS